jgi:hypothetical protein
MLERGEVGSRAMRWRVMMSMGCLLTIKGVRVYLLRLRGGEFWIARR